MNHCFLAVVLLAFFPETEGFNERTFLEGSLPPPTSSLPQEFYPGKRTLLLYTSRIVSWNKLPGKLQIVNLKSEGRKWGVRSVMVGFGAFLGRPDFQSRGPQIPIFKRVLGPLDGKSGRPKNANPATTDPTPHLHPSEQLKLSCLHWESASSKHLHAL